MTEISGDRNSKLDLTFDPWNIPHSWNWRRNESNVMLFIQMNCPGSTMYLVLWVTCTQMFEGSPEIPTPPHELPLVLVPRNSPTEVMRLPILNCK